jgi:hypothetical protein
MCSMVSAIYIKSKQQVQWLEFWHIESVVHVLQGWCLQAGSTYMSITWCSDVLHQEL